jgi:signal transduction histidine kinase
VQVLDQNDRVLANSSDIPGAGPLVAVHVAPGHVISLQQQLPFDEDAYRVTARGGSDDGRAFTVLVGQSLGPVEATIKSVLSLLAIGSPLLLVALGVATFVFVNRSLRPVGAIRATVASINERDLSERVVVPPADDEVSRLAVTMNALLERLDSAQKVQRQFVADASHELRSPIATLATTAEIALAHPDADAPRDFPTAVLEESKRLERLVGDLLVLARADERGLRPRRDDVDLDDLVDAERHRVASISDLAVTVRISATRAPGDLHQLRQVVRNLVDNAVQHAKSRVEFTVQQDGDLAVLEVFNDGPGIAIADRSRIFGRFVRLEESRDRASGGTGLGLAIVREIVAAHRGTVIVVDDPDGVRFRVELPTS